MRVHLVLVEPAGPINVGSVARLCANFDVADLRLVSPRCDHLGEEARRMAVQSQAWLERAPIFASLAAAIADCHAVVACTGRREGEPLPLNGPTEAMRWLLHQGAGAVEHGCSGRAHGRTGALVFGREDRGLSNDELLTAGCLLQIDTGQGYPSLNLSHAVAVVLHELQRIRVETAAAGDLRPAPPMDPPSGGAVADLLADARELLLEVGFLYPHTARARMAKLHALLQRSTPSANDVSLLRGMVCQLRWASRHLPHSIRDT